ncbi:MAG: ATP synthase F0 subunit B [Pseudomonadota bacterium]|jgi:F-type H+-transporting ATPase subunit b|nr:ATP synthase F0 subunit B [Syntrophaceae bacterium]MBP7033287.1 ATP synthase F0 subunit B [Syntrophobacterales bacterium]MDI9556076.1 ATP synthase F0 subunit B [Pseudomonadota bacterium]NLX32551.1 ATP synthase F0 subunit B [Deltaproteobacteria bacterium]OQB45429.1 MAG: ATP synthase subunit b [Firmicutes bacterium ADurb.Bin153]OQC23030.1 MAG: ATP synthase subunit b [Deltaproteobacteria bacterium ADurb.Bin072]HNU85964.1 ATP synthase F0 subunit B [Syntrophales bacterium]
MVDINATVFIQLVNFLLLIWILNQVLYKPLLRVMDRRKEILDKAQEEVKTVQETIDGRVAEYEEKIRSAKMEAMGQKGDLAKEGSEAAKAITDKAKGEIAGMMGEFQAKLEKELASARELLRSQSLRISSEIAEKVLGRSIQ